MGLTGATGEPYAERQDLGGACCVAEEETGSGGGGGGGGCGVDWGGGCCLEGAEEALDEALGLEEVEEDEVVEEAEGGV